MMKNSSVAKGADAKVIWLLLIVYADSGYCTIPPRDTNIEKADPGKKADPPDVKLNVVVDPLNWETRSSNFK